MEVFYSFLGQHSSPSAIAPPSSTHVASHVSSVPGSSADDASHALSSTEVDRGRSHTSASSISSHRAKSAHEALLAKLDTRKKSHRSNAKLDTRKGRHREKIDMASNPQRHTGTI